MLTPTVRRTWAPQGRTPIQRSWDRHDRLSLISALSLAPRRRRLGLYFQIYAHNIRHRPVVEFLHAIRRSLGRDLIVVLDRLNVHRAAARRLTERYGRAFAFEWLPAYAPELNPVEQVWNRTKYTDLANFIPEDIEDLQVHIHRSIERTQATPTILRSFFRHAQLDL